MVLPQRLASFNAQPQAPANAAELALPAKRLSEAAEQTIRSYAWPGNVRELRNLIERIVLLEDSAVIEPATARPASLS